MQPTNDELNAEIRYRLEDLHHVAGSRKNGSRPPHVPPPLEGIPVAGLAFGLLLMAIAITAVGVIRWLM